MRRPILLLCLLPALALAQSGPPLNSPAVPGNGLYTGTGSVVLSASPTLTGNVGIGGAATTVFDVTAAGGMARIAGGSGNNLLQASSGTVGGGIWAGGSTRFYSSGTMTLSANATLTTGIPTGYTDVIAITTAGMAITGTWTASAVVSSGAAQSGYLCYNTTGGVVTYDGGATCLVSREEYKDNLGPITSGLSEVMALRPFWGRYREGTPMGDHRVQPFLGARHTAAVDERLASFDKDGDPLGVRYENLSAVLVAAVQTQQAMILGLRRQLKALRSELRQVRFQQTAYR